MAREFVEQAAADLIISDWPNKPQEVARQMIEKYGPPDETTASRLIWYNTGPWKRTIVYRDEVPHRFPMPHTDLLEQVIDYRVPPEKFDELAEFDGSVIIERTKGEMAARCDKEEANFLAINLAYDIVADKRSVAEARDYYADAIQSLMNKQPPPYTKGLQFTVPKGSTADPDQAVMQKPG